MADPEYVTLLTLKTLAARCQPLGREIEAANAAHKEILDGYAAMLCDLPGVGTEVASQLFLTVGENPDRGNEAQFSLRSSEWPQYQRHLARQLAPRRSRGGNRKPGTNDHFARVWIRYYLRWQKPVHEILPQRCAYRAMTAHERLLAAEAEVTRLNILLAEAADRLGTNEGAAEMIERKHDEDRITP
jgi:hypothetical protein